jgi:hypothetical protein
MSCKHPKPWADHFTFDDGVTISTCLTCGTTITWNIKDAQLPIEKPQILEEKSSEQGNTWTFNPNRLPWTEKKPTSKGPWWFTPKSEDPNYIELLNRIFNEKTFDGKKSYKTVVDGIKYFVQPGGLGKRPLNLESKK